MVYYATTRPALYISPEPAHKVEDETDGQEAHGDTEPHEFVQRVHEGEDTWLGLVWLLDHDGNPRVHERLGEIHHSLTVFSDRQRSHGDVFFLEEKHFI